MNLAASVLAAAKEKNIRIATAESCTGGMIFAALTDVAGSSAVMDRGFLTYTNDSKIEMLGVSPDTLKAVGAVAEEVTAQMAEGALKHSQANLAVSVSGIAGPGGSEFKPEGRVCFGITYKGTTHTETVEFGAIGRKNVRSEAVNHALKLISDTTSKY